MGERATLLKIGQEDKFFVISVPWELSNSVAIRFVCAPKCRKNDYFERLFRLLSYQRLTPFVVVGIRDELLNCC